MDIQIIQVKLYLNLIISINSKKLPSVYNLSYLPTNLIYHWFNLQPTILQDNSTYCRHDTIRLHRKFSFIEWFSGTCSGSSGYRKNVHYPFGTWALRRHKIRCSACKYVGPNYIR